MRYIFFQTLGSLLARRPGFLVKPFIHEFHGPVEQRNYAQRIIDEYQSEAHKHSISWRATNVPRKIAKQALGVVRPTVKPFMMHFHYRRCDKE